MRTYMNDESFLKKGYLSSIDKSRIDFDAVFNYLNKESYWAKGIPADRVERSINNSMCFGIYKDNLQAGFARVVTDCATFAYICDVFVLPEHRGAGLSKWLMQTIVE